MSDMYRRDNGYVWSGGRREEAKNLRLLPASRSVSSTCKAEQQLAEERERERDLRFHTLMIQNWYMVRMYTRQPTSIQGPTSKVDISGTVFGRYVKVLYTTYVHRGSTRCKGCKSWKKEKSLLLKVRSLLKLQTFSFLWPPPPSPPPTSSWKCHIWKKKKRVVTTPPSKFLFRLSESSPSHAADLLISSSFS